MTEKETPMSTGNEQAGNDDNSSESQSQQKNELKQARSSQSNVAWKEPRNYEDTAECEICKEPFTSLSRMHPCGHRFDYACIESWFMETLLSEPPQVAESDDEEEGEKPILCPMCRQEIQQVHHRYQTDGTYTVIYPDEQFRGPGAARKAREAREAQEARDEYRRRRRSELRASYTNGASLLPILNLRHVDECEAKSMQEWITEGDYWSQWSDTTQLIWEGDTRPLLIDARFGQFIRNTFPNLYKLLLRRWRDGDPEEIPDIDEDEIEDIIQLVLEELKYLTQHLETCGKYLASLRLPSGIKRELVPQPESLMTSFDAARAAQFIALERLDLLQGFINILAHMKEMIQGAAQMASDRRFGRTASEHGNCVYTEMEPIPKSRGQPTWCDLLDLSVRKYACVPRFQRADRRWHGEMRERMELSWRRDADEVVERTGRLWKYDELSGWLGRVGNDERIAL